MTINQIEYFTAIVENKTYLEASETLNISQSSLSKHIINLEKELDVKLFDRTKRTVSLTEAGKVFYKDSLELLATYKQLRSHLKPFSESYHGTVRLGTLPILTQYGLTTLLKKFSEDYPGIKLIIEEVEDERLMYGLNHDEYDLVITRKELLKDNKCKSCVLATDELVFLCPLTHPFANKSYIDLAELSKESFILMHRHISIFQLCITACEEKGFTPNVVRTARMESILSAVAANEGISLLLKKNMQVFNHENLSLIPLAEPIYSSVVLAGLDKKWNINTRLLYKYIENK